MKLGFREDPMVVLSTAHPAKFPDAVIAGHRRAAAHAGGV